MREICGLSSKDSQNNIAASNRKMQKCKSYAKVKESTKWFPRDRLNCELNCELSTRRLSYKIVKISEHEKNRQFEFMKTVLRYSR